MKERYKYYADKHVVKKEEGEVRAGNGGVTVREHIDYNNKLSLKPFLRRRSSETSNVLLLEQSYF